MWKPVLKAGLAVFWLGLSSLLASAQTDLFPTVQPFPTYGAPSILIINQEALFSETALGQDILALEQHEQEVLIAEGRRIGAAFEAEEKDLTLQRDTLPPDEFRRLADAFDEKVVAARREQETNDATLIANIEARRRTFFKAVVPILAALMQRYSAAAIVDQRSVLLFDRNLDITSEAIDLLDRAYADDPGMLESLGQEND